MTVQTILAEFEQQPSDLSTRLVHAFQQLVPLLTDIAQPGGGRTYERWQILAEVAACNLNLAKWVESHLDALSILHELGYAEVPSGSGAVWAAEGGTQPIHCETGHCSGQKLWCSGADLVDYGLMTYRDRQQNSQLIIVDMHQSGIGIDQSRWHAVGMAHTRTATVSLTQVAVETVGQPGQYLSRPGFWHGAAGVAACWYGAAAKLASVLQQACQTQPNAFRLMYLGQVNTQLATTRQYFKAVAGHIDQAPRQSHALMIRILRAQVEQMAHCVLEQVGKALGARAFCENPQFAQLAADLPVFLSQSHAAFDLEQIGQHSVQEACAWAL